MKMDDFRVVFNRCLSVFDLLLALAVVVMLTGVCGKCANWLNMIECLFVSEHYCVLVRL